MEWRPQEQVGKESTGPKGRGHRKGELEARPQGERSRAMEREEEE